MLFLKIFLISVILKRINKLVNPSLRQIISQTINQNKKTHLNLSKIHSQVNLPNLKLYREQLKFIMSHLVNKLLRLQAN